MKISYNVYNKDGLKVLQCYDVEEVKLFLDIVAITEEIERHLKLKWSSVFTSHTIMPEDIMNEMVDDVLEASRASGADGFNDSDIEFAFQNVILYRLFSE